jgi:uncharacterized protein with FMN-binding domain
MKKGLFLVISTLLIIVLLVGCGSDTIVDNPGGVNGDGYKDGTYTATSNANERGYVKAEVVIKGGVIDAVTLWEFNDKGLEKDADYTYENFHAAIAELPGRFVEANSAEVDVVTGASSTSNKAMDAVDKALQRSKGFAGTFEGMHMGVSDASERGWAVALVVLDADGNISEVILKEIAGTDFKDEGYGYDVWHQAVDEMAQKFVDANSSDVDAFTGATGSSGMWMQAVEDALQKAQ